jgi:anti-anti-sigma factor
MTIEVLDKNGVKHMKLAGELGSEGARELLEAVSVLIAPRARLVLDLAAVPFVNSEGLSALVRVAAQANLQEGRVVLAAPSAFIAGVLQLTHLDRFFEVAPTAEQALAQLA